jgi:arylsulfatase A-like enzyme
MTVLASHWLSHKLVDVYTGLTRKPGEFWSPRATDINRRLLRWLDRNEGRPFFAFVNYFDAHAPYVVKEPFWRPFLSRPPRPWLYTGDRDYSQDELTELRDSYDAAIAYADHQLGILLDELERRGVLDNTLLIVASDHGEQFGDHGLTGHGNSLYFDLLHVPLVMVMPGQIPAAVRSAESVTLRDIPATIMDVLGLQGSTFRGESLRRYWTPASSRTAEPSLSELAFEGPRMMRGPIHRGSMQSLVMGDHHYIRNGDGVEELYDLFADPREQNDLSGKPESAPQLAEFRKIVESAIPTAGLGRVAGSRGER